MAARWSPVASTPRREFFARSRSNASATPGFTLPTLPLAFYFTETAGGAEFRRDGVGAGAERQAATVGVFRWKDRSLGARGQHFFPPDLHSASGTFGLALALDRDLQRLAVGDYLNNVGGSGVFRATCRPILACAAAQCSSTSATTRSLRPGNCGTSSWHRTRAMMIFSASLLPCPAPGELSPWARHSRTATRAASTAINPMRAQRRLVQPTCTEKAPPSFPGRASHSLTGRFSRLTCGHVLAVCRL